MSDQFHFRIMEHPWGGFLVSSNAPDGWPLSAGACHDLKAVLASLEARVKELEAQQERESEAEQ